MGYNKAWEIMNQTNYLKILWIVAFVAFASVSCWATSESLHMLLSTWPKIFCWVVTVGFFIIAALGTKLIVDSLNTNIYLEKRGLRLTGGILILLVFWLVCSMPTNTHTFFYRTVINDKVNTDIATTRNYLGQIKTNSKNVTQAELKIQELQNNLEILLTDLESEIMNEANPGQGPKAKEILRKFASLLGKDAQFEPLSYKGGTSKQDRKKLCDAYRAKFYLEAENVANTMIKNIMSPNPNEIKRVTQIDKNLALVKKYIDEGKINLNNAKDVTGSGGVCDKLNEGYVAIKNNKDFVNFDSKTAEAMYTAENPVTKVKRMVSVFDVWKDFLHKEYSGYGFVFWIIISILVDIAAFIFFDLAFRKTEY